MHIKHTLDQKAKSCDTAKKKIVLVHTSCSSYSLEFVNPTLQSKITESKLERYCFHYSKHSSWLLAVLGCQHFRLIRHKCLS